jgi:restriction endonuclease S subunit
MRYFTEVVKVIINSGICRKCQLNELDQKIAKLQEKANKAEAETKVKYQETLDALIKKREMVRSEFEKFKAASTEVWENLKVGMDTAVEDLEKAYKKALSHFK